MPSATSTSNVPSPRTPAWKRIGLKLKSSQETIATPLSTVKPTQELEGSKRKRAIDTEELTPAKKAKKREKGPPVVATTHRDSTPTLSRKKSVTFTPETKEEDGDSIKQLFSAWVEEQKAQDPTFGTKTISPVFDTPEPPIVEEQIDSTLDESERRVKRVKKSKGEKAKAPENSPTSNTTKSTKIEQVAKAAPLRPFLAYLKQYSESRETWKFSKNHQDRLLKHIFDADVIPAEYSPQIYNYVRGLQGAVRTRLRDAALEVKVKDQEDGVAGFPANMKDAVTKQREYDTAIGEYVATMTAAEVDTDLGFEEGVLLGLSDAAMEKRTLKRVRSERILMELGNQIEKGEDPMAKEVLEESQKRLRMEDGSAQKLRRKRKQRTMAVESDTSSSEDSSDSESDSDSSTSSSSDGSTPGTRKDDDTSSSSSSSSGSEGESNSESSSEEDDGSSDSD